MATDIARSARCRTLPGARRSPRAPGRSGARGLRQGHQPFGRFASWAVILSMSASALASRARILSTTLSGALARNASLPSLAVGLGLLLLGGRRGPWSGACARRPRRSCRTGRARPWRRRPGATRWRWKPSPSGWRRSSWRMAASCGGERRARTGSRRGRDLLAGLQALVGAEAADLGDDLLDESRSPPRPRRRGSPLSRRPVGDDDGLAAGERGPQRLGDERDDRVQQAQRDVEDLAQDPAGDLGRLAAREERGLGQLDVPVEDLVPREVVQGVGELRELVVVVVRVDLGDDACSAGTGSSGRWPTCCSTGGSSPSTVAPFISAKRVAFQILLAKLRDPGPSPRRSARRCRGWRRGEGEAQGVGAVLVHPVQRVDRRCRRTSTSSCRARRGPCRGRRWCGTGPRRPSRTGRTSSSGRPRRT